MGNRMHYDPIQLGYMLAMIINYWIWSRKK